MGLAICKQPSWLIGHQEPVYQLVPEGNPRLGEKAVKFCRMVGLTLYPWQEQLLLDMLRTNTIGGDELFAAREVVVSLARQNGKGEVLVARELVGVYLLGEKTILHTAHFLDTALDAAGRLWEVISDNPALMNFWGEDKKPRRLKGNGKESIQFPGLGDDAQIQFRTRTPKTGRGLSVELLVLDESFSLPNQINAGLESLTLAQPNAQRIYISSPVDRFEHAHGAVFSAKRWAAQDGAHNVLYKEWSMGPEDDPFAPETWAKTNPSLVDAPKPGVQLVEIENKAASAKTSEVLRDAFVVENLGTGNWVPRDGDDSDFVPIIGLDDWDEKASVWPGLGVDTCFGVDVSPGAKTASVVAASRFSDGKVFLSIAPDVGFDRERLVSGVAETVQVVDPSGVLVDVKSPASTLVKPLEQVGVRCDEMSWTMVKAALEEFLTLWNEGRIRHDGDERWRDALLCAGFRETSGGRAFAPARDGDITPLVAASFAVWAVRNLGVDEVEVERLQSKQGAGVPVGIAEEMAGVPTVSPVLSLSF